MCSPLCCCIMSSLRDASTWPSTVLPTSSGLSTVCSTSPPASWQSSTCAPLSVPWSAP